METLKRIGQSVLSVLGFRRNSKYVKNYLNEANIRSGIYMAVVVLALEIWMVIRAFPQTIIPNYEALTADLPYGPVGNFFVVVFNRTSLYWVMIFVGLGMLVFCATHVSKKMAPKAKFIWNVVCGALPFIWSFLIFKERFYSGRATSDALNYLLIALYIAAGLFGLAVMLNAVLKKFTTKKVEFLPIAIISLFALVCLIFGTRVSYSDYNSSTPKEIMCFLTMVIYVGCLLIWRPYISISLLGVIFLLFYFLLNHSKEMNDGDVVNYITFFISLTMVCVSIFNQRRNEATKDEELEYIANYDSITELNSYSNFLSNANILLEGAKPASKIFLFLNIEDFKLYNDQRGFQKGNEFLKQVGSLIKKHFSDDLSCRQSDDHFIILADAESHLERIQALHDEVESLDEDIKPQLKVGGYLNSDKPEDPHREVDKARYACSTVKGVANIHYAEYDQKMHEGYHLMQYVIHNIDKAVEEGWIRPYYQPVVWSKDNALCGCEALARWIDPKHGFMNPSSFVPTLENTHLIHKLDAAIIHAVCKDIRKAIDNHEPFVPVSINFSRLDFELMDAVNVLETYVQQYHVPKEYLHVEITESALMDDSGLLAKSIKRLKDLGYALWLDDFGSGYSSLNVLKDYDFDVMKIDMKFLSGFSDNNKKTEQLLNAVIGLANQIGMKTLTEGVETRDQAAFLREAGCGRLQGYLYGKAYPREEIITKIKTGDYRVSDECI